MPQITLDGKNTTRTPHSGFADWRKNRTGLYVPPSYPKPKPQPVAVDLFSGAGGFSLGILQAGFRVIAACDNDPWAAITYLYNLGAYPLNLVCITPEDEQRLEKTMRTCYGYDDKSQKIRNAIVSGGNQDLHYPPVPNFFFGDIRKLTGQMIFDATGLGPNDIDLVCGGPPCQGFSMAGKRDVMDPRNSLVFEFTRLVLELQPKMIVMENVPGIASMVTAEGLPVVDAICLALANGGWGVFEALKQTLLTTSGAGAAVKSTVDPKLAKEDAEEAQQIGLFD